jgi:uncharacterized protein (DUF305 family)
MNKLSAQLAAAVAAALLLVSAAHAQQTQRPGPGGTAMPMPGMGMPMQGGQGMPMPGAAAMSQNQKDMMQSMERMNRDMIGKPMTGNPDRDFVAMMAPHHQGAIDMARIYLREGKDPELRGMAEKIIADQEREIGEFNAWQAKHPS